MIQEQSESNCLSPPQSNIFSSDLSQCCEYQFSSYVLGSQPFSDTFQHIKVNDQDGKPVNLQTTGPMYVGFTANPFPSAGAFPWWRRAYTLPDVGLNHPARWQWNGTTQTVSFNPPDSSSATPQDLPFYQMKGSLSSATEIL